LPAYLIGKKPSAIRFLAWKNYLEATDRGEGDRKKTRLDKQGHGEKNSTEGSADTRPGQRLLATRESNLVGITNRSALAAEALRSKVNQDWQGWDKERSRARSILFHYCEEFGGSVQPPIGRPTADHRKVKVQRVHQQREGLMSWYKKKKSALPSRRRKHGTKKTLVPTCLEKISYLFISAQA